MVPHLDFGINSGLVMSLSFYVLSSEISLNNCHLESVAANLPLTTEQPTVSANIIGDRIAI